MSAAHVQGNGDAPAPAGLAGTALTIGQKVLATLPPAFIMLLLINCVFLFLVLRFVANETDQRVQLVSRIVDACMEHETPHK